MKFSYSQRAYHLRDVLILIWMVSAVLGASASFLDLSHTFLQTNNNHVDSSTFTQLLSNHLLSDHFDKAYLQLSKKISFHFRDAIQVKVKKVRTKNSSSFLHNSSTPSTTTTTTTTETTTTIITTTTTNNNNNNNAAATSTAAVPLPVDVQILKRQLKGAVGSFVEDKFQAILTNRHNLDSLRNQLNHLLYQYCPEKIIDGRPTVSYRCLLDNSEPFLRDVQTYTIHELQSTLLKINEFDLPRLFEKTRAQISGILIHFNQHTLDKNFHRLELKIKPSPKASAEAASLSLPSTYYNNTKSRNWITPDMILDFVNTVNHTDNEIEHTIQHFIDSSI